jgi:hypothetical protein
VFYTSYQIQAANKNIASAPLLPLMNLRQDRPAREKQGAAGQAAPV